MREFKLEIKLDSTNSANDIGLLVRINIIRKIRHLVFILRILLLKVDLAFTIKKD